MKINSKTRNDINAKHDKYLSNCLKRSNESEHDRIKLLFNSLILSECDNEAIAVLHLALDEINADSDDSSFRDLFKKMKRYGHEYIHKQDSECLIPDFETYSKLDNIALLQTTDDTSENRAVIFSGLIHIFLKEKFDSDLISTLEKVIKYTQENKNGDDISWPYIHPYPTEQDKLIVEAMQKKAYKKADRFNRPIHVSIQHIPKFGETKLSDVNGESHIATLSNGDQKCMIVRMGGVNSKEFKDFLLIESMTYYEPPNYKNP